MNEALEGAEFEKQVVVQINNGLIGVPAELKQPNLLAIHVTSLQFSKLNNKYVRPKADIFFVTTSTSYYELNKGRYLCEEDLLHFEHEKIINSGVSVKKIGSHKITLLKIAPTPFIKLFDNAELGAGASIYISEKDIHKNADIIKAWHTVPDLFNKFFSGVLDYSVSGSSIEDLKKIKEASNKIIMNIVNSNKKLEEFIFTGKDNFDQPYTAPWLYSGGNIIQQNSPYPLTVTTGSGRSKGIYTLVFKPA